MSKFKKMAKKATSILVSLTTTVWLAGFGTLVPFAAQADSVTDALNAQIQSLLAQIQQLQAQLNTGGSGSSASKCTFTRDLQMGVKGDDVKCLQTYMTSTGHYTYSGGATGFFGSITKAAVSAWQAANSISPTAGYFGAKSRAKYDMVVASTPTPTPTTTQCNDGLDNDGDNVKDLSDSDCSSASDTTEGAQVATGTGLTVMSGTQPAASLAVENGVHIPFTSFRLTASSDGDVKVDSVTVERTGLANDAVFSGIVILDENMISLTNNAKSLNSNHQAVLTEDFVIPAGQTKTFYLAGNMAASLDNYAGQVAYLQLVAVNTTGAAVSGSLPISGVGHTINGTLTVGSITLTKGAVDPGDVSPTKEVGTKNYIFTSLKATAGSAEDMMWTSIRFNQAGSAALSDLANVKIYDSAGTAYVTNISADGKYFWTDFGGTGLILKKGESKEVYIKGDIVGGSNRTVDFDLYRYDDAVFKGQVFGYKIKPTATETATADNDNDAEFQPAEPRFDADRVTIGAGSLRIEKSNAVPSQNIANGDDAATLGSFMFEAKGESVSFTSWTLTIATTNAGGSTSGAITNVTVYDKNGAAIAGPIDYTKTSVTFTDTVTVPVGQNTFTVKGNLDNNWENSDTIIVSFDPDAHLTTVKGVDTGTTVTPTPGSTVTANTQTVKAAALVVSPSSSLAAQGLVEGSTGVEVGRLTLDASNSGEDLRITTIKIHANMDTAPTSDVNDFASFQLFDGTKALNTGSNVLEPAATAVGTDLTLTITLDSPGLIVPKQSSKVLSLKANITTGFGEGDVAQFDFVGLTDGDWTVSGVSTGSEITEDLDVTTTGSTITIRGQGGWSVSTPSTIQERWVAAGSTGVTVNVLRFSATTEDFALTDLRLQIDTTGSSSAGDFAKISLWDGNTKLVEKVGPAFTNDVEDFSFPTSGTGSFNIPKDSYKDMTVKIDLAGIGAALSGTPGELVGVDYDGASNTTKNKALGAGSGQSVHSSTATDQTGNGVVIFRSVPTLEVLSIPQTSLTSSEHVIYKFRVKADPAYDVALRQFTFEVSTTGITGLSARGGDRANFTLRNVTDGNKRVSAATGTAAEFYEDDARYSDGSGTLLFRIVADTTDYGNAWVPILKDGPDSSADDWYVFELRATVQTDGSGDSISTKLKSDSARPSRVSLTGAARRSMLKISLITNLDPSEPDQAATASTTAFIWSDYSADATSTGSHTANTADWMNGFKVPGLISAPSSAVMSN